MGRRLRRDLALPTAPGIAARRHAAVPIHLDAPMDLFPEAGITLDYRAFAGLVERAAALLAGAGARPGARITVVKGSNFDVPLLAFACARIGAVAVLVHPGVGGAAIAALVERSRPAAIVTDADTAVAGLLDEVPRGGPPLWFAAGPATPGALLLREQSPADLPQLTALDPGTPQLVTHTSGTTGIPKLVLQTAETFDGQCRPQAVIGKLLRVRDPYLVCISPTHVRTVAAVVSTLALGLPFGFMTDPGPGNAARMLERVRPGAVETVPNAFIRWEQIAEERPDLLAPVRIFMSTFDAAHPRTINALLAAAPRRARYIQVYGQSETGPVAMKFYRRSRVSGSQGSPARGLTGRRCVDGRCVGRPLLGQSRVRIAPDADPDPARAGIAASAAPTAANLTPVGRGTPGAILARTRAVTPAYLGTPDQRIDGWWAMGDYGLRTRKGCVHLHDRLVDRDPGVDSLLALEDTILERIAALTEAVLVPVGDGPPVPLVCTRGDEPLNTDDWNAVVADLPPLAAPVQCRWEEIPHTATWKVKRAEAASRLAGGALTAAGQGR
jgi:acyl-coenzyme A synthetase/AMP-(fatty) acid ligase